MAKIPTPKLVKRQLSVRSDGQAGAIPWIHAIIRVSVGVRTPFCGSRHHLPGADTFPGIGVEASQRQNLSRVEHLLADPTPPHCDSVSLYISSPHTGPGF
ncbi:MAG: hypothetical protein HN941_06870 [Proteobacteria bacterium]|nr:hypothetical protein [Pseudomonadota bacterium]